LVEYCTVAAPGSILLLGEYAVTEPGGPGAAMAVRPEVHATLDPGAAPRISGRMGARRFTWTPKRCDSPIFSALVAECGTPAGAITVDSTGFAGPHGKLGLGSSAAVAVAVAALLVAAPRAGERECDRAEDMGRACAGPGTAAVAGERSEAGRQAPRDDLSAGAEAVRESVRRRVFAAALAAHRAVQGGRGSGYDVATSVWGGVVSFRGGSTPAVALHRPPELPALRLVQGTMPLATAAALARYEQWRQREPHSADRFRERSREVVEHFLAAGDAAACCAAIEAGGKLTRWLGARIGVAVEPPDLRARLDRFRARGWVAKPVGAGGELGIAASPAGTVPPDPPDAPALGPAADGLRWLVRNRPPACGAGARRSSSPV